MQYVGQYVWRWLENCSGFASYCPMLGFQPCKIPRVLSQKNAAEKSLGSTDTEDRWKYLESHFRNVGVIGPRASNCISLPTREMWLTLRMGSCAELLYLFKLFKLSFLHTSRDKPEQQQSPGPWIPLNPPLTMVTFSWSDCCLYVVHECTCQGLYW